MSGAAFAQAPPPDDEDPPALIEPAIVLDQVAAPVRAILEPDPVPIDPPEAPAPDPEPAPEPEPAVEPAIAPAPAAEPTVEALVAPVLEPVVDPVLEPVVDPVLEPVVEALGEPVQEAVAPVVDAVAPVVEDTVAALAPVVPTAEAVQTVLGGVPPTVTNAVVEATAPLAKVGCRRPDTIPAAAGDHAQLPTGSPAVPIGAARSTERHLTALPAAAGDGDGEVAANLPVLPLPTPIGTGPVDPRRDPAPIPSASIPSSPGGAGHGDPGQPVPAVLSGGPAAIGALAVRVVQALATPTGGDAPRPPFTPD